MRIILSNKLYLEEVPLNLKSDIIQKLTLINPKYEENEKLGYSNWNTPQYLKFYDEGIDKLTMPRGCIDIIAYLLRSNSAEFIDNRRVFSAENFKFNGNLKEFQQKAVKNMLAKDFGVLCAPTGAGKTVCALKIIADRKQPTIIIVHTKELLYQWIDRINTFLGIEKDKVGIIGDGSKKINSITIALIQSLYKCANDVKDNFGMLIVDECHKVPSRTFTEAVSGFDCKYMLGLSATPYRRDKLTKVIYFYLGNMHYNIEQSHLVETGDIVSFKVIAQATNFYSPIDATQYYSTVLSQLTEDIERNRQIAADIAKNKNNNGTILVLTDRKKHCDTLYTILKKEHNSESVVLTGSVPNKERKQIIEDVRAGKTKILIATGQLIGEGFDCKNLSTLFFATPIKFNGRLIQYLGRVLRSSDGKTQAMVYDYVDNKMGIFEAAFNSRKRVYYKLMGHK
ncbi:MAG: DEAD/DEAH box helicase [Desulfobacterales bacterium]|nr:DEAD/DEAH box helicase [Desulfobacterales bacterium]